MKQGALIFDEQTDRYDIRFDLADYYGGLHCGETFDVMVGGRSSQQAKEKIKERGLSR